MEDQGGGRAEKCFQKSKNKAKDNEVMYKIISYHKKYVFEDFNYAEAFKVVVGTSRGYNEIWWFYPSLSTNDETTSTNATGQNRENNRYVKYNFVENVWDVGTFSRTAWEGGTIFENDISADANRLLYNQEVGTTDDGSPINAYVESSDFDIDDGQKIMFVDKALPVKKDYR